MVKLIIATIMLMTLPAFADMDSRQAKQLYNLLPGYEGYGRIVDIKCGPVQSSFFNPAVFSVSTTTEYYCKGTKSKFYFQGNLALEVYVDLPAGSGRGAERQASILCGENLDTHNYVCGAVNIPE